MTTPQFIYFDLGNVLAFFDYDVAARQMAEVAGVNPEKVREIVFDGPLETQYESGDLDDRGFYDAFCRATGTTPDFAALRHAGGAMFELNVAIAPLVAQLKLAGYRLGVLSNTCPAHWDFCHGRFRLLQDMFQTYILSYQVGAMKPDAKIYLTAVERAGVEPDQIFYMDDREENVVAAGMAGMDAVLFEGVTSLAEELRKRGVETNY